VQHGGACGLRRRRTQPARIGFCRSWNVHESLLERRRQERPWPHEDPLGFPIRHFDHLPNYRDDTILSWLTAKVLLGVLLDRIGSVTLATATSATSRPLARQPWKLTAILWPMMISALMPIRLAEAAEHLPGIADLLDEMDAADRPQQVSAFRDQYYPAGSNHCDCGVSPPAN
jgi:hypothetical protein